MSASEQFRRFSGAHDKPKWRHAGWALLAILAGVTGAAVTSRWLDTNAHASTGSRLEAVASAGDAALGSAQPATAWRPEQANADEDGASTAPQATPAGTEELITDQAGEWQHVGFLGSPEQATREKLRAGEIVAVEKGRGGRSLSFKITLADGTQGYFKPAQTFSAAHWYAEVASYYLDRVLGLGRVPPVVSRRVPWATLRKAAGRDRRIRELEIGDDGTLPGAFVHWLDADLTPIDPGMGWERWIRVEGAMPRSPYQRPRHWAASRSIHKAAAAGDLSKMAAGATPDRPDLAASISDMILFDYLTANVDRWGGRFTNVRTFNEGGPLMFFDNGAGFAPGHPHIPYIDAKLKALQRFRRDTVAAIRDLDLTMFERLLASDPQGPLLSLKQLEGLKLRRDLLLAHVDDCVERFGEAAVYF